MKNILLFLIPFVLFGCQPKPVKEDLPTQYPVHLGEIAIDADLNDSYFYLCDSTDIVQSRIALSYEGGFRQLEEECHQALSNSESEYSYDGLILVRFIVNCDKKTGRFRFQTLDAGFAYQGCPEALREEIKSCVAKLNNWIFIHEENRGKDHSKYLNFKFENGELLSIIH